MKYTAYDLGKEDYLRGAARGFGGDGAWGERQRGWDDARKEAIERWNSSPPKVDQMIDRPLRALQVYMDTVAAIRFKGSSDLFLSRGAHDAMDEWLQNNGAEGYHIQHNFIAFTRKEDAIMCFIAFR